MEFLTDPTTWWIEPFTTDGSMRNALLTALLAVVSTSVIGTKTKWWAPTLAA